MESLENHLKLKNTSLSQIRDLALVNFKDLAKVPGMDADQFLAFCWAKATLDILRKDGHTEIKLVKEVP